MHAMPRPTNPYQDRIRRLVSVLESVQAEREFAMFRAHQHGATVEEIAGWALVKIPDVRTVIDAYAKEPDIDTWCDGPDFVVCWPN